MSLPTGVEWGDGVLVGGAIEVDDEGVFVSTTCHGCWSKEPFTDLAGIEMLRDALTEYLNRQTSPEGSTA